MNMLCRYLFTYTHDAADDRIEFREHTMFFNLQCIIYIYYCPIQTGVHVCVCLNIYGITVC